jgi:hypothetical protein
MQRTGSFASIFKKIKKNLDVHPHILYPHTNFRKKMTIFMTCVKKQLVRLQNGFSGTPLFIIFT